MTCQVLARKWRPHEFQTVVGQEHVLQALTNALNKQRLHHAYLFTGTRGVGKTSIARILAKCLNCELGISATPCNKCSNCKSIDEGRFVDLIEVDAASRTRVEDTRELLDNVQYKPTYGRFKIYLIDEVHMLSGHSFNALLKTLEEPPAHVKFLLATTTPEKLPITVLSRCLQFHLTHLSGQYIFEHLKNILTIEKIDFEDAALQQIAKAANGSIRDALSIVDQAIAFTQDNLSLTAINDMLGIVEQDYIKKIFQSLIDNNCKELLTISNKLALQTVDFDNIFSELLVAFKKIAICQLAPEFAEQGCCKTFIDFAKKLSKEDVQLYYQIILNGRRDLPFATDSHSGFEMTLLRALAFRPICEQDTRQVVQENSLQTKLKNSSEINNDNWGNLISKLNLPGVTQVLATHCIVQCADENKINLALPPKHSALLNDKVKQRLQTTLYDYFGKEINLNISINKTEMLSVAKREEQKINDKNKKALDDLKKDNNIETLRNTFDVIIDPKYVEPLD